MWSDVRCYPHLRERSSGVYFFESSQIRSESQPELASELEGVVAYTRVSLRISTLETTRTSPAPPKKMRSSSIVAASFIAAAVAQPGPGGSRWFGVAPDDTVPGLVNLFEMDTTGRPIAAVASVTTADNEYPKVSTFHCSCTSCERRSAPRRPFRANHAPSTHSPHFNLYL